MSTYHATISLSAISSDPRSASNQSAIKKGGKALSTASAVSQAKAHVQYIVDPNKTDLAQEGMILASTEDGHVTTSQERRELIQSISEKLDRRTQKLQKPNRDGSKKPPILKSRVRVMDKIIVSLPNDATLEHQAEIGRLTLSALIGDSGAFGIAAIHGDCENNKHMHIALIDGPESRDAAQKRAETRCETKPDKVIRVRQGDHLRLNEAYAKRNTRLKIGEIINNVADRHGLRRAELRSLEELGIEREPQIHEGPRISQARRGDERASCISDLPPRTREALEHNVATIMTDRQPDEPLGEIDPRIFPERLRPYIDDGVKHMNEAMRHQQERAQKRAATVSANSTWVDGLAIQQHYMRLRKSLKKKDRQEAILWRYGDAKRRLKMVREGRRSQLLGRAASRRSFAIGRLMGVIKVVDKFFLLGSSHPSVHAGCDHQVYDDQRSQRYRLRRIERER
ncbi:MobA/MobL family protein [Cohaesibacter marisflavi]|uniref:MobA/MobL family protein n=1 Tax=Cohaesibacter marisflavi TaxID=655353 RepID=A0A1I5LHN3_9HYPH|nr:MobA/MobL family protein [Cohaesibacter marisflavi]SFO96820.1 MobA/MobL family protein [Cohaesibacter marisflavi]